MIEETTTFKCPNCEGRKTFTTVEKATVQDETIEYKKERLCEACDGTGIMYPDQLVWYYKRQAVVASVVTFVCAFFSVIGFVLFTSTIPVTDDLGRVIATLVVGVPAAIAIFVFLGIIQCLTTISEVKKFIKLSQLAKGKNKFDEPDETVEAPPIEDDFQSEEMTMEELMRSSRRQ